MANVTETNVVETDPLAALVRDPHVRDNVDWEVAVGLPHVRQTDYLIGRAVDTVVELVHAGNTAAADEVSTVLEKMRTHPLYAHFFRSESPVPSDPQDRIKNRAYAGH